MRRVPLIVLCTAGAAAVLAGCGGSTTVVTDSTSAGAGAGPQATASSATVTSSRSPVSTSTTSAAGAEPLCTAGRLTLEVLGQQGATGHGEIGFALRNAGTVPCRTFGFPGVLFRSATGAPLPTDAQRVTHDFFGAAPAVSLSLGPGQRASFRLGVTHGQASSAGCLTAAVVQVIPPDDTHTLRVAVPQGIYECGTATVSPLRPGTSAFG